MNNAIYEVDDFVRMCDLYILRLRADLRGLPVRQLSLRYDVKRAIKTVEKTRDLAIMLDKIDSMPSFAKEVLYA